MDLLKKLGDKVKVHTTQISVLGVTYQQASRIAKQIDWLQFHINKHDGGKVDASFIACKKETQRIWDLINSDNPEAPDPRVA